MDLPKSRKEAKEVGSKYYFTGNPCKRGHITTRETKKGICSICRREDWKKENDRRALLPKSAAAKASAERYYEKNKELVKARAAARPKEEKSRWKKAYKERNKDLYKVITSARKRRHRHATPQWLSYRQKQDIKALYMQAIKMSEITGERYVVDHIIPLINPTVCGLHVPWNLRVITQEENLKKSNKHEV